MNGSPTERAYTTRTILADREPTVRRALRALATQSLGMQVVGEADSATDLKLQVTAHRPDLVVVAWDIIGTQADAMLAALHDSSSDRRIVVLGLRPETRGAAMTAGADGYISLVDGPDVVTRVLQAGAANEPGVES